jgi:hypothetical protein
MAIALPPLNILPQYLIRLFGEGIGMPEYKELVFKRKGEKPLIEREKSDVAADANACTPAAVPTDVKG